ncbi:hypothetical protein V8F20_008668 [Naviculisporaceae sp. PSN 640]
MSRKQRYLLALDLASSFLQLLNTPWLPVSWKRSDIVFLDSEPFKRLQPYLRRDMSLLPLTSTSAQGQAQSQPQGANFQSPISSSPVVMIQLNRSLDKLGILLLELCFGLPLESQDRLFPRGVGGGSGGARAIAEEEKEIFNMFAARNWLYEVEDEAGQEYFRAVAWCLGSVSLDRWRMDMLKEVVEPLSRCGGWLEGVFI